jgi:hypothetical protein
LKAVDPAFDVMLIPGPALLISAGGRVGPAVKIAGFVSLIKSGTYNPNRLDTANGLTPTDISVSGTVSFNQTPCAIP